MRTEAGFLPKTGTSAWVPRLVPRVPESPPKAAPRRRLRHHSETPSEDLSVVALPIWLGSSSQEIVLLKDIKSIVPEDLHQHDDVIAIEEAESDASFCATYRRFVDAAEHLEQAICVRQQLLGDDHEELLVSIEKYVVSCNAWGVECLSTGNYIAALELFKKAEAMTEAENVPNFKRRVALRAVTFNNLCCYYRTRGKLNAALQFAEKALKIEEKYKEADSPARSYLNYGVLLSNSGRHSEALERVERAVAVLLDQHRHEEAEATQKPEPTETSQLLVVAHYNMFVEHLHLKQFASSLQCLQRAVSVAQSKLGTSHTLTIKMQEVHAEAQARLERKASAECFRTTAAAVESSPVFFHYQDGHCHPWQKVHLSQADAARAQEILADQKQITLRRLRPPDPRPPEKPRIKSRRPKQTRLPAIGAEVTSRFWESHPKLLDTEGYAGSPILTQQAHGTQPMVEVLAQKRLAGTSPRGGRGHAWPGGAERDVSPAEDAKAATQPLLGPGRAQIVPAPPGAPPEVVASWEYHHRRLQMLDEGNGLTALEPHRMRAISVLRDRLDKRREKGLPAPTDYRKHQAATCIQAGIRGYLVRQWTSEELAREMRRQRLLEAAAGESSPTSDAKKRMAFRVIYAARRAFVEYNAAVKIQKVARGSIARAKLNRQISKIAHASAAKVQALVRGRLARSSLRRQSDAATRIQAYARMRAAKHEVDSIRLSARHNAAVKIQKVARGNTARAKLKRQLSEIAHSSAAKVQALVRGRFVRNSLRRQSDAATRVQAYARMRVARHKVDSIRRAARLANKLVRGFLARRRVRKLRQARSEEAEHQAAQCDAVMAGILEAGLSSRCTSPVDLEGASDASPAASPRSAGPQAAAEQPQQPEVVATHESQKDESSRLQADDDASELNAVECLEHPHFASSLLEVSHDSMDASNLLQDLALQDPDSAENDHFASSLLEESVSQEDPIKIIIEKAEPREPDEPFEDQDEASAALVESLVGDALGDSMASRLMTPQPEESEGLEASPKSASAFNASRDTAWTPDDLVANVIEDVVEIDGKPDSVQDPGSCPTSMEDVNAMDPSLVEKLQQALLQAEEDPCDQSDPPGHPDETPADHSLPEAECDAVLAGILDAGLSSRCSSPVDLEGASEASRAEEAEHEAAQCDAVMAGILEAGLSSRCSSPVDLEGASEASQEDMDGALVEQLHQATSQADCSGEWLTGRLDEMQATHVCSQEAEQEDTAWAPDDLVANVIEDVVEIDGRPDSMQDPGSCPTSMEDVNAMDPSLVEKLQQALLQAEEDPCDQSDPPGHPDETPADHSLPVCSQGAEHEAAECDAVMAGILEAGLSSRCSSPVDLEGASEASQEPMNPLLIEELEAVAQADDQRDGLPCHLTEAPSSQAAVDPLLMEQLQAAAQADDQRDALPCHLTEAPSSQDAVDPLLVEQLLAAAQDESLPSRMAETPSNLAGQVSEEAHCETDQECNVAMAGILETGLSSRWSSPENLDFEGGSDASEEADGQVVGSVVASQLQEVVQAYESGSQGPPGIGGAAWDSGIDEDVAGPSIEDLGKANSSIADINQEVENMVPPADPAATQ
ncbi:ASPM [Symbiodinium sp. CCMP2592]|nr:ASPM [Symbiodinium sp. CCMP2592]